VNFGLIVLGQRILNLASRIKLIITCIVNFLCILHDNP
jgi:hypothetical protein